MMMLGSKGILPQLMPTNCSAIDIFSISHCQKNGNFSFPSDSGFSHASMLKSINAARVSIVMSVSEKSCTGDLI